MIDIFDECEALSEDLDACEAVNICFDCSNFSCPAHPDHEIDDIDD